MLHYYLVVVHFMLFSELRITHGSRWKKRVESKRHWNNFFHSTYRSGNWICRRNKRTDAAERRWNFWLAMEWEFSGWENVAPAMSARDVWAFNFQLLNANETISLWLLMMSFDVENHSSWTKRHIVYNVDTITIHDVSVRMNSWILKYVSCWMSELLIFNKFVIPSKFGHTTYAHDVEN
jgi:hypothetical protein